MECRLRRTTVLVLLHSSLLFAKICDFGVLTLAAAALDLAHWIFVLAARSLTTEAVASGCPGLTSLEGQQPDPWHRSAGIIIAAGTLTSEYTL